MKTKIYLERDGKVLFTAQSFTDKMLEDGSFRVRVYRLLATEEAIKIEFSFYEPEEFNIVVETPESKLTYSGCKVESLSYGGTLVELEISRATLIARERTEKFP